MRESCAWRITNTNHASCGPSFIAILTKFSIYQAVAIWESQKAVNIKFLSQMRWLMQNQFLDFYTPDITVLEMDFLVSLPFFFSSNFCAILFWQTSAFLGHFFATFSSLGLYCEMKHVLVWWNYLTLLSSVCQQCIWHAWNWTDVAWWIVTWSW